MRMLLIAQMDTEKANQAISDDRLPEIMKSVLGQLQPESVYFGAQDGLRTGYIVFDLKNPSDIPGICEPLFKELGTKVHLTPVMSVDELQAGLGKVGKG
jgi:hypothetical protein